MQYFYSFQKITKKSSYAKYIPFHLTLGTLHYQKGNEGSIIFKQNKKIKKQTNKKNISETKIFTKYLANVFNINMKQKRKSYSYQVLFFAVVMKKINISNDVKSIKSKKCKLWLFNKTTSHNIQLLLPLL